MIKLRGIHFEQLDQVCSCYASYDTLIVLKPMTGMSSMKWDTGSGTIFYVSPSSSADTDFVLPSH